jgi:hypothetical protein
MRHVRMLGLCLVAAFALSALAAVPALAKSPYTAETVTQFKYCPYTDTAVSGCFQGQTLPGYKGGFFKLGGVVVPLSKPITIQGGFSFNEKGEETIVSATNGGETLESPELKVDGGLSLLNASAAGWPTALKQSFKEAKKNKEGGLNVKIEVAGTKLYETPGALNTENLIDESGPAMSLPLKVRLISPWLEKLASEDPESGTCETGSNEAPIWQYLTSEAPGEAGELTFNEDFTTVALTGGTLVDLHWGVGSASYTSGCGGAYESYVDAALNGVEKPYVGGTTELSGTLYTSNREYDQEQFEG